LLRLNRLNRGHTLTTH